MVVCNGRGLLGRGTERDGRQSMAFRGCDGNRTGGEAQLEEYDDENDRSLGSTGWRAKWS